MATTATATVLDAITAACKDDGLAYVTTRQLAETLRTTPSRVRRALERLEKAGKVRCRRFSAGFGYDLKVGVPECGPGSMPGYVPPDAHVIGPFNGHYTYAGWAVPAALLQWVPAERSDVMAGRAHEAPDGSLVAHRRRTFPTREAAVAFATELGYTVA